MQPIIKSRFEQFSDGVGYRWIDSLKAHAERTITDKEFSLAAELFPYNTPDTKEAFLIRKIFHKHFPQDAAARTVVKWIPKGQTNKDPSGRVNEIHIASSETRE